MNQDQTFLFIEMVQAEEILWNISDKNFKDTTEKLKKWDQIGSAFGVKGNDAYAKFRSLREKYRREKAKETEGTRSGSAASSPSNWPFMKHMAFLDQWHKKRRITSSSTWKAKQNMEQFTPSTSSSSSSSYPLSPLLVTCQDGANELSSPTSPLSPPLISPSPLSPPAILPSPLSPPPSSSLPLRKERALSQTLESTFSKNTENIVNAMKEIGSTANQPNLPYEHVVQFARATLIEIGEEKAKQLEKEMMELLFKYKYN